MKIMLWFPTWVTGRFIEQRKDRAYTDIGKHYIDGRKYGTENELFGCKFFHNKKLLSQLCH